MQTEIHKRYQRLEQSANAGLPILVVSAMVSVYFFDTHPGTILSCICAGAAIFVCWRTALQDRQMIALMWAIAGLVLSMAPVLFSPNQSSQVSLAQGLPLVGSGLLACVVVARLFAVQKQ